MKVQTKHQSPSNLPGEGRFIGSCRTPQARSCSRQAAAFCVSQHFPKLSFSTLPSETSLGLCFPAVCPSSLLWVGSLAGPGVFHPWTGACRIAGATQWWQLGPLFIQLTQQIFIQGLYASRVLGREQRTKEAAAPLLGGRWNINKPNEKCVTAPCDKGWGGTRCPQDGFVFQNSQRSLSTNLSEKL